MDNTSGQGRSAVIPPEIDRWNWGAFLLSWVWGIGNQTFIALLMFVPVVNLVMPFVLGAKGSIWAWRNKRWDSVEHFQRVQRKWARWGVGLIVLSVAALVAVFVSVSSAIKQSQPYTLAQAKLAHNPEVVQALGEPLQTGTPMGHLEVSGPTGHASLSFGVEGPKGQGTAYVEATKDLGRWRIDRMALDVDATGQRIVIP